MMLWTTKKLVPALGENMLEMLKEAKKAKNEIANLSTEKKNLGLEYMAQALKHNKKKILEANSIDLENAKDKITEVMLDRLRLTDQRIEAMAKGILDVINLKDPVNNVLSEYHKDNGLLIKKVSVPMGVIGIIYESRPNVTSDVAALCLKSGNVSVLRSGKEAFNTSKVIIELLKEGLVKAGINPNAINMVMDTSRQSANDLMKANDYLDLLIPRGGKNLIETVVKNATVPTIQTGQGICHIYVHKDADFNIALKVIENGKCSRPSVCNALEVLLIDEEVAPSFLPELNNLLKDRVLFKTDELSSKYLSGVKATNEDYDTEFLDYIMAVKCVKDVNEAIEHINTHSTHHSEAIITKDTNISKLFVGNIDSAACYINASTRFTDGGEFGLGCEIGISTQKLHARGPMGLNELCTYKYIIEGEGQCR